MEKARMTNDNDENVNLKEQRNEVNEDKDFNRTYLSKWHNEVLALAAIGTLIVTTALAIITYCSLREVQKQRDLTYKQFVMANRPNVNIGFEGRGLRLEEKIGYIDWQVGNKGGDVEDLKFKCVLFHMKAESKSNYSINEFYVRNIRQAYLNKDTRKSIHNQIEKTSTLKKVNDILRMDKRFNILGLYLRVEYRIPAELTLDGKTRKDNRFEINAWDVIDKRFENVKVSWFDEMVEKISEKKFNSLMDQG